MLEGIKKYIPKEESSCIDNAIEEIKMQGLEIHRLKNELTKWYLGQKQPVKKMDSYVYGRHTTVCSTHGSTDE